MQHKISKGLIFIFSLLWIVVLLFDYYNKHPNHAQAFQHFKYFNFLLVVQLLGISLFTLVHFLDQKIVKRWFYTGLSMIGMSIIFISSILYSFAPFVSEDFSIGRLFVFIGNYLRYILSILVIFGASYNIGKFIGNYLPSKLTLAIYVAIGIMILTACLFVFGVLGLLNMPVILVLFILPLVVFYKSSISWFKTILIDPIQDYKKIDYWGFIVYYGIVVILSINILSILSAFPYGFDSRNYYMNIASLIDQNASIVKGFQPYNWSLFMSSGFIGFKSPEVAMLLSQLPIILICFCLRDICRKHFKMSINNSLLIMLLFIVSPAVFNQLFIELKIDLGLLYFQMAIIYLFLNYIKTKEKNQLKLLILIGTLSGFALGIKFTHTYLLLSMVMAYWAVKGNFIGLSTAGLAAIALALIGKIDEVSGLRIYHLGVSYQQWIIAVIFCVMIAFYFFNDRKSLIKNIRFSVILGAFSVFAVSPWIVKNYIETKSLSPRTLLIGENPGVKLGVNQLISNYQKQN